MLWRIIVSICMFTVSFLLPDTGVWRIAFCIIAYLISGYDVIVDAVSNLINGQLFDEKFLMTIATFGAFALGESHEAVFVMVFFQIGELFESIAVGKSRRSVAALFEINPEYANIFTDGKIYRVSPEEVKPGDIIVVKPGERIPLDGVITNGESSVNTAALTGESMPLDVGIGDTLISGCINITGLLYVRVTKAFSESTVARILELVEQSASNKSKSEAYITRFAHWYTPIVVTGALLLAVIPPLFIGNWSMWIHRALIFLVISCPCALVISVPLSYFGAIGRASKDGILIKGSNYLDVLGECECCVFDKTGTLTKGSFSVKEICAVNCDKAQLIEYAAYSEAFSDHPIAESLRSYYDSKIDESKIHHLEEYPGFGVKALLVDSHVMVGNSRLMDKEGIVFDKRDAPGTHVYVAVDGVYMGYILITDELKDDSKESIKVLKRLGIKKTVMLTGDSRAAAESVADELGIDECYWGLLPEDKINCLEKELNSALHRKTAYIGDGMNDAPCLSRADLGVAMGALGSDAAIEAADIVLMDDKISKLPLAIKIARKTKAIVKQNIVFALGVKIAILILGAFGFAGMWAAVFADVGVCVIAILNAMRTYR